MSEQSKAPKLIVFDLDLTLWQVTIEIVKRPLKQVEGKVYDSGNSLISYYPDVPAILKQLRGEDYSLAVASRSQWLDGALELIGYFGWDSYISYKEIYPGSKLAHFERIQKASGVPFTSMLFFDDEYRNIVDIQTLGVTCVHVKSGLTFEALQDGLAALEKKTKS